MLVFNIISARYVLVANGQMSQRLRSSSALRTVYYSLCRLYTSFVHHNMITESNEQKNSDEPRHLGYVKGLCACRGTRRNVRNRTKAHRNEPFYFGPQPF